MQWIKVFTDIFANPKIKILLKERDGDTFFRVWIQLLTIAGQCMQEGKLMISENNPMTVHELATIIHKTDAKMENILNKLIHLEMLIYQENTYIIKNWYKYQSIDKYEKILEQNRARQKMVKIRLQREGKKKAPFYHIVVADSRSPRDGKIIEQLGTYNPMTDPATIVLDKEKVEKWIKNGAKPTDTVKALIEKA